MDALQTNVYLQMQTCPLKLWITHTQWMWLSP